MRHSDCNCANFSDELHRSVDEGADGPGACFERAAAGARETETTSTRTFPVVQQDTQSEVS